MHHGTLQTVVSVALLICIICPAFDLFDRWDHAIQTGNETEYNLVILALCVGIGVCFARLALRLCPLRFACHLILNLWPHKPFHSGLPGSWFLIPIALSPPVLTLRI
jgi:hypothetical protein